MNSEFKDAPSTNEGLLNPLSKVHHNTACVLQGKDTQMLQAVADCTKTKIRMDADGETDVYYKLTMEGREHNMTHAGRIMCGTKEYSENA